MLKPCSNCKTTQEPIYCIPDYEGGCLVDAGYIECRECGFCTGKCKTEEDMHRVWNATRPDGVVELIEACKQFLDIINESRGIDGWHMNGDILLWDQCEQVQMMEDALQKAIAAVGGEHE